MMQTRDSGANGEHLAEYLAIKAEVVADPWARSALLAQLTNGIVTLPGTDP